MTESLAAFSIAASIGLVSTWAMRSLAWRTGFLSQPNPIVASHRTPVAYLGGAAVAIAIGLTALLSPTFAMSAGWCVPAAAFLALGLADDRRAFGAAPKFALQLVLAAVAVALGSQAAWTGWPAPDFALSALWILIWVNACNLVDVSDGLLAGLVLVHLLTIVVFRVGDVGSAAAIAGALLALRVFNRPPARIYLGDAGSHLLGFLIAWHSMSAMRSAPVAEVAVETVAGLALVFGETLFLVGVRAAKGLAWWKGSPDHFALRLQARGWSRARVLGVSLVAALPGALWTAGSGSDWMRIVSGLAILGALLAAAWWLLEPDRHARRRPGPGSEGRVPNR